MAMQGKGNRMVPAFKGVRILLLQMSFLIFSFIVVEEWAYCDLQIWSTYV